MRPATLLALLVLMALPTAAAASSASVDLAGPSEPVALEAAGVTVVPVSVTLAMDHFSCTQESEFLVALTVAGSGVDASLDNQTVAFRVPAQSFLTEGYTQTSTVNVTLQGQAGTSDGFAELTASFTSDGGTCFAPGGFSPAYDNLTLRTRAAAGNVTTGGNETGAGGNATLGNETNTTGPGAAGNLTTPRNQTGSGGTDYIGGYQPPAESVGENDAPGPGVVLALVAVAAALLLRRKA